MLCSSDLLAVIVLAVIVLAAAVAIVTVQWRGAAANRARHAARPHARHAARPHTRSAARPSRAALALAGEGPRMYSEPDHEPLEN